MSEVLATKEKKYKAHQDYPYQWCKSCRSSHTHGKNHNFTKTHQQVLLEFLKKQYETIQGLKTLMRNPIPSDPSTFTEHDNFRCFCCEEDIDTSQAKLRG